MARESGPSRRKISEISGNHGARAAVARMERSDIRESLRPTFPDYAPLRFAPSGLRHRLAILSSRSRHPAVAILAFVAGAMHRSATLVLVLTALALPDAARAQPAPTFQARCGELREAMAGLKGREEDELTAIEVVGTIAYLRDLGDSSISACAGRPIPACCASPTKPTAASSATAWW